MRETENVDQSHLDAKYFIDDKIYNCPFCNRRNVHYKNLGYSGFNWSTSKICSIWRVKCTSCDYVSMHLTFEELQDPNWGSVRFRSDIDLDSAFFYSVPTSFFVVDSRIPRVIRELITEAEGCVKMNFLTGASACTRKAIYELLLIEKAEGSNYEERIKSLKSRYPNIDSDLFDILSHIKDMTSDKVHEQSWDKWDSKHLLLFIETLKAILYELYVLPDEKRRRSISIKNLIPEVKGKKEG